MATTVNVLLGDGTRGFSTATNFPAGSNPVSVTVGDFNGDQKPDLAVTDLRTFLDEQPRARRGYIICRCSRPQQLDDRITALPWSSL